MQLASLTKKHRDLKLAMRIKVLFFRIESIKLKLKKKENFFKNKKYGGRSSIGRTPDCGSGCRGFKSRRSPHLSNTTFDFSGVGHFGKCRGLSNLCIS